MILALIVNTIGFLQILTQTFYTLHKPKEKGTILENLLVRWVLLIVIILIDNICIGIAEILPFGTYVYNYYKLMIFVSKNDFYVTLMQKFIVKADPDVLGQLFLTLIARTMIKIMHMCCKVLKNMKLPVSQTDFNLSQEIMEFLEEYHPQIIKTSTILNNTSFLDQSTLVDNINPNESELLKKKQEEKRKRQLEKQRRQKLLEDEILKQQQELLKLQQKKLKEIQEQGDDDSFISDQGEQNLLNDDNLIPQRDFSNNLKQNNNINNNVNESVKKSSQKTSSKQIQNNQISNAQTTKITTKSSNIISKNNNNNNQNTNNNYNNINQTKKQENYEVDQELNEFDQQDEDDLINNIDFNDNSSKQEDSSSNEKVYPLSNNNNNNNQPNLDQPIEDDFEVLHKLNVSDADLAKKKSLKSTTITSSKPPTSSKSNNMSVSSNLRNKTTTTINNNSNTTFSYLDKQRQKQSIVENNNQTKDQQNTSQDINNQQYNQNEQLTSLTQSYIKNDGLITKTKSLDNQNGYNSISEARNHLDSTRNKFEQYKMKYAGNTRLTSSTIISNRSNTPLLINKDN